jgi:Electron transfer DM13
LLAACGGGGGETAAASPAAQATACTKTSGKVGQSATLSTRSHNVRGQAKIIDDCTIEISNVTYDAGGLSRVFVYGAKARNYAAGFPTGSNLRGTVYNNKTLRVTLQAGDLDRLDGISIWCSDANANFGDGLFAAP